MLGLVDFPKSTFANYFNFFEESRVSVLLEVLTELVIICLLFAPEDEALFQILSSDRVLRNSDELDLLLIAHQAILLLKLTLIFSLLVTSDSF